MTEVSTQKSTTVRTHLRSVPPAARAGIRLLDQVAPGLTARLALYVWCRPGRPRRPIRLPGGTGWQAPVNAGQVTGQTFGASADPDQPRVYLVHGWGGHRGQFASLIEPLVAAGYQVIAYDAPSHGDSGPGAFGARQSTLPEMAEALAQVIAVHGPAYAVIAHSLGSSVSALAVLDGLQTERLALIAPMADPTPYTVHFAQALGFSEPTRQRFMRLMAVRAGRPIAELDLPVRAYDSRRSLPPTLIVHDRDDRETDYQDGVELARAWPKARLELTSGLGHRRILRDPATIALIVDSLGGRRAPVVAGRSGQAVPLDDGVLAGDPPVAR